MIDAIGPETFTYHELVQTIGQIIGKPRPVVGVPTWFGFLTGWLLGKIVGDQMITWQEIKGLSADLLATNSKFTGTTRLTDWARAHDDTLGVRNASELARRKDRRMPYLAKP